MQNKSIKPDVYSILYTTLQSVTGITLFLTMFVYTAKLVRQTVCVSPIFCSMIGKTRYWRNCIYNCLWRTCSCLCLEHTVWAEKDTSVCLPIFRYHFNITFTFAKYL